MLILVVYFLKTICVEVSYKNVGGIGVNIFKNGKRKFGVDFHKINYKGVEKARLHYHRGNSKRQRNKHRPYEGCW
jgi:hypothetical protein